MTREASDIQFDRAWPPRDAYGRVKPHHLIGLTALRAFPWLLRRFTKEVPGDYWTPDTQDDGRPVAIVACVCGEGEPIVPLAGFAQCEGCGRWFFHSGQTIKVAPPVEDGEQPVALVD